MMTTVPGRRSQSFTTGIGAMLLLVVGMASLLYSPAMALPRTGVVTSPGGLVVITDPCFGRAEIVSFIAMPAQITLGQSVTLSWNVEIPDGECGYMLVTNGQLVGRQGSMTVQPLANTSYTLSLTRQGSLVARATTETIYVSMPIDPSDPTRTKVTIPANRPLGEVLPLFVQALGSPNTTVMVNSDLNLSGLGTIVVADGVRLIGGRVAVPGQPFQPGPRLYTTTRPASNKLFSVQGDNVRVTGVRLEGPNTGMGDGEVGTTGITVDSSVNIEIDHNELYGWDGAAVEVVDSGQRIDYVLNPETVRVHDNYIHHNQNYSKLGYGVVVSGGAYALIERNVFDWNRHAISGDGSDGSGYRAYRNMVLEHGGYQRDWGLLIGWSYTHQFDMHGQGSCGVGSLFSDTIFNCGTAGHDIDIRYNSFLYTAGPAVKVRGTPQLGPNGAFVRFNVFAHDSIDEAVEWTETGVLVEANQVNVTSWAGTDSCDFDGDGVSDVFLATGQTWWFSSNHGQGPWVFLNASTMVLHDVVLGYFDGDQVCDVMAGGLISSGGTSPWKLPRLQPVRR